MSELKDSKAWLTALILGAANVIPDKTILLSLAHMNSYNGKNDVFEIFGVKSEDGLKSLPLAETKTYRLYVAKLPSGQLGLMKIALTSKFNNLIVKESQILKSMQRLAQEIDEKRTKSKETPPFYGAMFPQVIEEFDAGGRRAMFLGYKECIDNFKQLVPLSVITATERVDLQTTHWVLGKLLKLLTFFHSWGITYAINLVNTSNVLVETNLHGVFVLDFSEAIEEPMKKDRINDIMAAGKMAWEIAGGTDDNDPPFDKDIMSWQSYTNYLNFIRRLMNGETDDAYEELFSIYELSDQIWPKAPKPSGAPGLKRQFHEFRTYKK